MYSTNKWRFFFNEGKTEFFQTDCYILQPSSEGINIGTNNQQLLTLKKTNKQKTQYDS